MANREEVLDVAKRMSDEMQKPEFIDRFRQMVEDKGMLFANQLFDQLEELQIQILNTWNLSCDGAKMLQHLKMAVKSFPDETCKMTMMMLVGVEEKLLDDIQHEVAKKNGIDLPPSEPAGAGSHGHSHNGKPCHGHGDAGSHGHDHGNAGSHGHSHNGKPCHGHGAAQNQGAHGHSHNGKPCHGHGHGHGGMPQMNPQQMAAMQMAMNSLSDQQKRDMQSMQAKMMSGQPPTPEDQRKMMQIQQHLSAYMATMQAALQGAQKK